MTIPSHKAAGRTTDSHSKQGQQEEREGKATAGQATRKGKANRTKPNGNRTTTTRKANE